MLYETSIETRWASTAWYIRDLTYTVRCLQKAGVFLLWTPAVPEQQSWGTTSSSCLAVGLQLHAGSQEARSNGWAPLHAYKAFWGDSHAQKQGQAAASPTRPPGSHVGRASGVHQCARVPGRHSQLAAKHVWARTVSGSWKILFDPARLESFGGSQMLQNMRNHKIRKRASLRRATLRSNPAVCRCHHLSQRH